MPKKRKVVIGSEIHDQGHYSRLKGETEFVYRTNLENRSSNLRGDERHEVN